MRFSEIPKTTASGRPLKIENAIIESVSMNCERGFLDAWLHTRFGSGGCGFGGFVLAKDDFPSPGLCYASHFLLSAMRIGASETWEKLAGKPIRVLSEGLGGGIVAIGHFLKDDWFCPKLEFDGREKQ